MRNLRIDGWVIARPRAIGTVSSCVAVRIKILCGAHVRILARQEVRQPVVKHNVLVGGNGELASSVEDPLVFFVKCVIECCRVELSCPKLVNTEPQDSHG